MTGVHCSWDDVDGRDVMCGRTLPVLPDILTLGFLQRGIRRSDSARRLPRHGTLNRGCAPHTFQATLTGGGSSSRSARTTTSPTRSLLSSPATARQNIDIKAFVLDTAASTEMIGTDVPCNIRASYKAPYFYHLISGIQPFSARPHALWHHGCSCGRVHTLLGRYRCSGPECTRRS